MRFRKPKEERRLTKVEKRVASLSTQEIMTWTDQVLYSIGRNISSWQKTQNSSFLEEATIGAEALHALTKCLAERTV